MSSATPLTRVATVDALRGQLDSLVQASLTGGGMPEAMDLRFPTGAYSELEVLFGYYRRDGDPDEKELFESLPKELPALIRELASGGEIAIEISNHADKPRTPRQSDVFFTLQAEQRKAMFSATLTRKGGAAPGKPSALFLENLTLLGGRFRYMGPLRRGAGLDCARLAVGPAPTKSTPTLHDALPKGARARTTVEGPVFDVAWAPSGDHVFVATPDGWSVWDPLWTGAVRPQQFFADWTYCAIGREGPTVPTPPSFATVAMGGSGKYGPDASAMLLGPDGAARLLYRAEYYVHERARVRGATAAAISVAGEIAIARADGSVCRGEAPDCTATVRSPDPSRIVAMAFTRGGDRLVAVDESGRVLAWPELSAEPRKLALSRVERIALAPDGRILVATGPDGMAAVSLEGELPAGLAEPRKNVLSAAFTTRGSLVTGTSTGEVRISTDLREPTSDPIAELGEPIARLTVESSGGIAVAMIGGPLFMMELPASERADVKLGPPPIGDLLVYLTRGEHPGLAGYTISGIGDPPVPIAELRRRLLAGRGQARLVVERPATDPPAPGLAILKALASETQAAYEERSPGPPGRE